MSNREDGTSRRELLQRAGLGAAGAAAAIGLSMLVGTILMANLFLGVLKLDYQALFSAGNDIGPYILISVFAAGLGLIVRKWLVTGLTLGAVTGE